MASAVAGDRRCGHEVGDGRANLRDGNARLAGFDIWLRVVEGTVGKVDQRLKTLERLRLPTLPLANGFRAAPPGRRAASGPPPPRCAGSSLT